MKNGIHEGFSWEGLWWSKPVDEFNFTLCSRSESSAGEHLFSVSYREIHLK